MKRTLIYLASFSLIAILAGCANHGYRRSATCSTGSCNAEASDCASCNGSSCNQAACDDPSDPNSCKRCRGLLGCHRGEKVPRGAEEAYNPGPASGAVTYPYYTNRGPRDYLARELPSIGP
jgi:hypothetical protein